MTEEIENKEDLELKKRLAALDAGLQNQQKEGAQTGPLLGAGQLTANDLRASRVGTEMLVAMLGGAFLGWAIDKAADTMPLFLLVFAFLGFGTGIYNVWRLVQKNR
jgi:ATP synthase protein I